MSGAVGIVSKIASVGSAEHDYIGVTFPQLKLNDVRIHRVSVDFKLTEGVYITRQQFPLILSYSMTIHKSQGTMSHVTFCVYCHELLKLFISVLN